MWVIVDPTSGQRFYIVLNLSATVLDMKKEIETSHCIAVSSQELYHEGKALLNNDLDLKSYGIVDCSIVKLAIPAHVENRVIPQAPDRSSDTLEAFIKQGWPRKKQGLPAIATSNDDQMLPQTKQSIAPSNAVGAFFNKDCHAETPLKDQDMRKMQGFLPASTTEGNTNIQEKSGRNANNQDLLQGESSNTFGEDRPLLQRESSNPIQTEQSLLPSSSTEQRINTQDLLVRDGRNTQVVQTEKSPELRNFLDSPAMVESLEKPPQQMRVIVLPYSHDNKPVKTFPVSVYASEKVKGLKKDLETMKQRIQLLDLPQKGFFFIHKKSALDNDQSFQWNGVADGDTIEIYPGHVTKDFLT